MNRIKYNNIFLVICVIFVISVNNTYSQLYKFDKKCSSVEATVNYGFILPHHDYLNYLIKNHVKSFEINYSLQTDGHKRWHGIYKFPQVGFGYNYIDWGNPKYLGKSHSLYAYFKIPWIKKPDFTFGYYFCWGMAYLTNHFDVKSNYYNIILSTKINNYANFSVETSFKINKRLKLNGGLGIIHISNGNRKEPNLGINFVQTHITFNYAFYDSFEPKKYDFIEVINQYRKFVIYYCAGRKEIVPYNGKKYFTSSLILEYEKYKSEKHNLGLGMDLFFDTAKEKQLIDDGITEYNYSDFLYAGVHASLIKKYGKLSIVAQQGIYFWRKAIFFQQIYNRFGFRYAFTKHLEFNFTLKTFFGSSDYMEWGIGYCL